MKLVNPVSLAAAPALSLRPGQVSVVPSNPAPGTAVAAAPPQSTGHYITRTYVVGNDGFVGDAPDWFIFDARLIDANGNPSDPPSYLEVTNVTDHPVTVSREQVGGTYTIAPGDTQRINLAIYSPQDQPLQTITV